MSTLIPTNYKGQFIEWNLLQIIEANNLFSKYFIPWLILKYDCTDILFQVRRECSELSVRSEGVMVQVGEFVIGENQIEYLVNNNAIENQLFFDFIVQSLKTSSLDGSIKLNVPFYGDIKFRLASNLSFPQGSTIVCRILTQNREIYSEAERLLLILMNIEKIDKYNEEEESIFNLLYYSITNQYINFNKSLEEPIEILKRHINLSRVIRY
jgi:hypothetical protein